MLRCYIRCLYHFRVLVYHFSLAASSILLLCVLRILCMQVILLMATALNVCTPELSPNVLGNTLILDLRIRQQCIAEITEMIHVSQVLFFASIIWFLSSEQSCSHVNKFFHNNFQTDLAISQFQVASLIHDDVLDDADTRRGIGSLSSVMGNKVTEPFLYFAFN